MTTRTTGCPRRRRIVARVRWLRIRGSAGGPAPSAPPDGAVIVASNMSFDRAELMVPADRPFQLLFENRDGAPHNVTVLEAANDYTLFVGDVFSGAASRLYDIPAIAPGTYRFRCDVHPDMAGTIVAETSSASRSMPAGTIAGGAPRISPEAGAGPALTPTEMARRQLATTVHCPSPQLTAPADPEWAQTRRYH